MMDGWMMDVFEGMDGELAGGEEGDRGWMDGWIWHGGWMDGWMGWMEDGWMMVGWMVIGWMAGWMGWSGWMDGGWMGG